MDAYINESRTGSGTDWGLRAAPLSLLADYMRLGKWLDLRTDEGLIQRVRIVEVRVYVQSEDIVLRQEWLDREEFRHGQVIIDSESIWKVVPSNYDISQVKPFGALAPPVVEAPPDNWGKVRGAAIRVAAGLYSLDSSQVDMLSNPGQEGPNIMNLRHAILVVVWERTDADPRKLCEDFGYRSPQPLLTARWKVAEKPDGTVGDMACRVAALKIGHEVDRTLGTRTRRSYLKEEELCTR